MNLYCFLVLLVVPAAFGNGAEGPKRVPLCKTAQKLIDDCRRETNTTQESAEKFLYNKEFDGSREQKCFIKCSWQKMGLMKANGDWNNTYMRLMFSKIFESEIDKIDRMWLSCKNIETKDDLCNYVYGVIKCFLDLQKQDLLRQSSSRNLL